MSENKKIVEFGFGAPKQRYEITAKKLPSKKVLINSIKQECTEAKPGFPGLPKISFSPPGRGLLYE